MCGEPGRVGKTINHQSALKEATLQGLTQTRAKFREGKSLARKGQEDFLEEEVAEGGLKGPK